MADNAQLDVIEKRVSALESIVFGSADKDALYPKDKLPRIQCIESLLVLQTKILAAISGKKRLPQIYENLISLHRYLDPAYTDELGLSDEAKAEIILTEEDYLRVVSSQLQTLQEENEALNSEHVKSVTRLSGKLQELSKIHIQQQDETAQFTEEAAQLIGAYNALISSLSKMFVQWDAEITKLEIKVHPHKSEF